MLRLCLNSNHFLKTTGKTEKSQQREDLEKGKLEILELKIQKRRLKNSEPRSKSRMGKTGRCQ